MKTRKSLTRWYDVKFVIDETVTSAAANRDALSELYACDQSDAYACAPENVDAMIAAEDCDARNDLSLGRDDIDWTGFDTAGALEAHGVTL